MHISIKQLMEENNLSRYELAKRVGITYPTITGLYNETSTSINLDVLEKLCNELNCTPNDILIKDDNHNL